MIKLLWRFALLLLIVIAFTWAADRPGHITIQWLGREVQTSVMVACAILLITLGLLALAWSLLRRLFQSPALLMRHVKQNRKAKADEALARGLIAVAAGDADLASSSAARAARNLGSDPLVKLLSAQAAQLNGEKAEVRRLFEEMSETPETEALGLRGLFTEARKLGDDEAALQFAARAHRRNPNLSWANSALLQLQAKRCDWRSVDGLLKAQIKSHSRAPGQAEQNRAIALAADALQKEAGQPDASLVSALKAHRLDEALVPAAVVAARLYIRKNTPRKAKRILNQAWKSSPHPDLAEVMAHLMPSSGPQERYERVRDLVTNSSSSLEGDVALARAAIEAQHWTTARNVLSVHLDQQPEARICVMMAEIEDATHNKGAAREWLARAVTAPRDPMWVSDGVACASWTPVSPVTGEITPCLWKRPYDTNPPPHISNDDPQIEVISA